MTAENMACPSLLRRCAIIVALLATPVAAQPFGDAIPSSFQGSYARSRTGCSDKKELAFLRVTANRLAYYEADEYLLLGVSYEGSPTNSSDIVPMFNGRFTVRQETNLLGETNLQLVLEKPNLLVRYSLKDNGEPDETHPDRWVRCPDGKRQ